MISFELFSINCLGSNINWKDKNITIKENIKYIITNIEHYQITNTNTSKEDEIQFKLPFTLPFTYSDILKYWKKNIGKYSSLFKIDFNNLTLDTDYSIAPLCISRNTNNDFIVIGIFLLDNHIIDKNKENFKIIMYTFLSIVKPDPLIITKKCDSNKYNIFLGILNYSSKYKNDNLNNKYLLLEKYNYKIPMKTIIKNSCNYLPKIEIKLITNKSLQGIFKIS